MIEEKLFDGVLWLTLSRPELANALDQASHDALARAMRKADERAEVGAVVLTGAGERAFCAGADLKEFSEWPAAQAALRRRELLLHTLDAMLALRKPMMAAIQAPAVGAGAMLALVCDEVLMADTAWLGFPESRHAMPSPMGAVLLERRANWPLVQGMLQGGDRCEAARAVQAGIADQAVSAGQLADLCQVHARRWAAIPAQAYAANKQWLNARLRQRLVQAAAHATRLAGEPSAA